jgi:hypothetical protein
MVQFLRFLRKPVRFDFETGQFVIKNGYRSVSLIYQPVFIDFENVSIFEYLVPTIAIAASLQRTIKNSISALEDKFINPYLPV